MTDARPEPSDELDTLAGEYVLGVLDSADRRELDRKATFDPQLAAAIAGWERRLAPMLTAVVEVTPPATLWASIEHAKLQTADLRHHGTLPSRPTLVAQLPAAPAWRRLGTARPVWPWRVATLGSLALAAGLATMVLLPSLSHRLNEPVPGAREVALVAVLTQPETPVETRQNASSQLATDTGIGRLIEPSPDTQDAARAAGRAAGFLAATWPDGTVVLTALAPPSVSDGKSLELWIQTPGAKAPTSMGVIPAAGRQATLPSTPAAGTVLSVTLEPPGGSPTGVPTGRVVYAGTLRPVRR